MSIRDRETGWRPEDIAKLATAMSRRRLMTTAFATVTLAGLGGRVSAQTPAAPWSFLDDKGVEVTADVQPTRIAADLIAAAALWDFGVRPVAVFGWDVNADDTLNVAAGNIDPAAVAVIGNVNAPLDLEKAIGADVDLFVTLDGDPADPAAYWSIDTAIVDQVRHVAPLLAINTNYVRTDLVVSRFSDLAAALGADLASDDVVAARAEAEAAATAFAAAASGEPGLTAIFIFANDEGIYIANPKVVSDLIYFAELGLAMPELSVGDDEYWEVLSWEESARYPADVIFTTSRAPITADDLKAHPVFSQVPAVQAGQIFTWNDTHQLSYQGLTDALTDTATALAASTRVATARTGRA